MKSRATRTAFVLTCSLGCLVPFAGARAATVRLAAVAVNGERFAEPQGEVEVYPGDRIEVEILVSGWGTEIERVQRALITVDNEGLGPVPGTSTCGTIQPLNFGYDVPRELLREGAFFCLPPLCGVCSQESSDAGMRCNLPWSDCSLGRCIGLLLDDLVCETADDCRGGSCDTGTCVDGTCDGGWHPGEPCAQAESPCEGGPCVPRDDFLLDGADWRYEEVDMGTNLPNYRFVGMILIGYGRADPSQCAGGTHDAEPCEGDADCPDGACDLVEFYFGTVILEVGQDAIGTFYYRAKPWPDSSISEVPSPGATVHTESLIIQASPGAVCDFSGACCVELGRCEDVDSEAICDAQGGVFAGIGSRCDDSPDFCQCPHIVDSYPPNCAMDARWPHRPEDRPNDIDARLGIEWVDVTLSPGTLMSLVDASAFVVRDPSILPLRVEHVEWLGGTRVRVYFDHPLPQQRWICLLLSCRCCGSDDFEYCWGALPGDVDNSGVASAADVLELIDYLRGEVDLEYYQCDIDHSGVCNATDILAEIDLLNGAGNFQVYNGVSQPGPCPTEP